MSQPTRAQIRLDGKLYGLSVIAQCDFSQGDESESAAKVTEAAYRWGKERLAYLGFSATVIDSPETALAAAMRLKPTQKGGESHA